MAYFKKGQKINVDGQIGTVQKISSSGESASIKFKNKKSTTKHYSDF